MRTKVAERLETGESRPSALDVGCGPGLLMVLFSPTFDVKGMDLDPEMVRTARGRELDVVQGDAMAIPFVNGSFDVVYCSFTLLWLGDPQKAVREMARASRRFVVLLAEPDYGGRISEPKEVAELDRYLVGSLVGQGADPFVGRKLGAIMEAAGLEVELGVHPGVWSPGQLRDEANEEWASIANAVRDIVDPETLESARSAWDRALADRSLFLFNPVFYAIGRK